LLLQSCYHGFCQVGHEAGIAGKAELAVADIAGDLEKDGAVAVGSSAEGASDCCGSGQTGCSLGSGSSG